MASVGRWLACPSYISQCVPNYWRGPGFLRLHCTRGQIWHFWRFLCQICRCCGHVSHLEKAEKSVSYTWRNILWSIPDWNARLSFVLLNFQRWSLILFSCFFFDTDTTCRTTSGRISTKQLTIGWQPSARKRSSWVEINPTWPTWWGNTTVSLCSFYVHCTWTCTLVQSEMFRQLLDGFSWYEAMEIWSSEDECWVWWSPDMLGKLPLVQHFSSWQSSSEANLKSQASVYLWDKSKNSLTEFRRSVFVLILS